MGRYLVDGVVEPDGALTDSAWGLGGSNIDIPTTIVAVDVMQRFGIPLTGNAPSKGTVPRFDIHNMDAVSAIRLSLAENFVNHELWEIHGNYEGEAEWVHVGATNWSPPSCLILKNPTYSPRLQGDIVIVRGYDTPPKRFDMTSRTIRPLNPGSSASGNRDIRPIIVRPIGADGTSGQSPTTDGGEPDAFNNEDDFTSSTANSAGRNLIHFCSIIFFEPVTDGGYKDDLITSTSIYNPRCFESVITWRHRMDYSILDSSSSYADAQIEFSSTATVGVPLTSYNGPSVPSYPYTKTLSPDFNRTSLIGSAGGPPVSNAVIRTDPYGELLSTFQEVNNVIVYGQRVVSIAQSPGLQTYITEYVPGTTRKHAGLHELGQGTDWTWEQTGDDPTTDILVRLIESKEMLDLIGTITPAPAYQATLGGILDTALAGTGYHHLAIGEGMGYLVGGIWCNVVLNVPAINVYAPRGDAVQLARSMIQNDFFKINPVVLYDPPAPTYFYMKNPSVWTEQGGLLDYPGENIAYIDFEEDLGDSDPTTQINVEMTDSKRLQNLSNGFVVDVSLPFITDGRVTRSTGPDCDPEEDHGTLGDTEIRAVTGFLGELYEDAMDGETAQYTYSASVLDDDLPMVGNQFDGDPNSIINTISYSFQDGSSFTCSISTGPKLLNVGSWGTSVYRKQTEDVTREGVVTQVSGNGAVYGVRIWRFGSYAAISAVRDEIEVGDRVQVTVYNNPVEL